MKVDWAKWESKLLDLNDEERRIVQMLAAGETLPSIGKALGQHRSRIWRKVEKIKLRLPKERMAHIHFSPLTILPRPQPRAESTYGQRA